MADQKNWKKNPVVGFVLIVVIFLTWYFILKDTMCETRRKEFPVVTMCKECRHMEERMIGPEEDQPLVCSECGKKAVVTAFKCKKCGTEFPFIQPKPPKLPEDMPEDTAEAEKIEKEYKKKMEELQDKYGSPKCPKCGSLDVDRILSSEEKAEIEAFRQNLSEE